MYKCKTCQEKIAENASHCPYCGDIDPIWNKEIKKMEKKIIQKTNINIFYCFSDVHVCY